MKKAYRVERMTIANYDNYMSGSNNYHVELLNIEAENTKEAIELAKAEGYVVNENYVKEVAELEAEKKAREEAWKAEEKKKAEAKAKREANEARKAEEAGMTVEEYRKAKARKAKITKMEKEIAEMEKELARKKARLTELKK